MLKLKTENFYKSCRLCPRSCGVDRASGEKGVCGETSGLRVATASIHRGEEPPIAGEGGSGAIFVSGCNLGCAFCQNRQISQGGGPGAGNPGMGAPVSDAEFADICLALAEKGAENINIVTGSHAIPAIVNGIVEAKTRGLAIPVLWNSSAYESAAGLSLLESCVDVYLPDLKTLDSGIGSRFFRAPDYGEAASAAILKMIAARPEARFRGDALISGVVIRHLVLPGCLDSTRQAIRWFSENASGYALLSLMMQYTPVGDAPNIPQRCISEEEYETVLDWLDEFGIEDGFYQELVPDSEWLPDFSRANPFSSGLSTPVWHWKEGFAKA